MEIAYDFLILATGARHSIFRTQRVGEIGAWAEKSGGRNRAAAPFASGIRVRGKITDEAASQSSDDFRNHWRWSNWCGNGRRDRRDRALYAWRRIFAISIQSQARVILIEGDPRLLAAFPEDLSASAMKQLVDLGVEVRTGDTRHQSHRSRSAGGRPIYSVSRENLGGR